MKNTDLMMAYNIFPSWQETHAGKNKTSQFLFMETELQRQL